MHADIEEDLNYVSKSPGLISPTTVLNLKRFKKNKILSVDYKIRFLG